jgi:CHASE2 domain
MSATADLWKKTRRHLRPLLLMSALLIVITIPELDNAWIDDPCAMQGEEHNFLTNHLYGTLSSWALHFQPSRGPDVAIVYIDPKTDPAELLTNTCLARLFISSLVTDIKSLHPREIVVDKFYSYDSCMDDTKNAAFQKAMVDDHIPIVVGRPTQLIEQSGKTESACLVLSKPFPFDGSNVHYGLTRLNSDVLKIPLAWPTFEDNNDPTAKPKPSEENKGASETLSLVAAKLVDPSLENLDAVKSPRSLHNHPFTSFLDLPNTTALAVRCKVEQKPLDTEGQELLCSTLSKSQSVPDFKDKVVVIGDKSDQDMQPFPDAKKERPGVWLQANYVKSILDRRFLREVNFFVSVTALFLFIIGVYCLHFFKEAHWSAFKISLTALGLILLTSFLALIVFKFYTPLWVISSAIFLVIFRYLETLAHDYSEQAREEKSHRAD